MVPEHKKYRRRVFDIAAAWIPARIGAISNSVYSKWLQMLPIGLGGGQR